jgi:hypothetical protein
MSKPSAKPRSQRRQYWESEMAEYILLMHDDAISNDDAWGSYIQKLQQGGFFEGGSAIATVSALVNAASQLL